MAGSAPVFGFQSGSSAWVEAKRKLAEQERQLQEQERKKYVEECKREQLEQQLARDRVLSMIETDRLARKNKRM